MLATTTNLNRFLNKAERIIRNDYNEKGLIVCARIDNVFAINYNGIPFILSVNVAPFNVIVYSISLSSDSKNYIIKSRGTCGNQKDVISDIYVDLLHYVRDNYASEDFVKEGIAKECTDCTDFCEEDCIENVECAKDNDVFEGCKMTAQTDEEVIKDTIISDDNIAYQTAKVTKTKHSVLEVMQCMMCPADKEGNRCGGEHWCKQTCKRYAAIVNPEWHHVSLSTLANIDNDMLDEKRQRYFRIYKELIKTIRDLRKCKTAGTYQIRWWNFKQVIADDIYYKGTTLYMTRFLDAKISMCNVECGLWPSVNEKATSFIKSKRYGYTTLKQ